MYVGHSPTDGIAGLAFGHARCSTTVPRGPPRRPAAARGVRRRRVLADQVPLKIPDDRPNLDELEVRSWRQDGCDVDVVAARGVAVIYVEGRFAEEVLHPTAAFKRAIEQCDISFREVMTRYSGLH